MQIHLGRKKFDPAPTPREASREARALLREMLEKAGLPMDKQIEKDENGRPYAVQTVGTPKFDFNFSHAGRYVVCALAIAEKDGETPRIGVDVEIPHEAVKKERLSRRFFTKNEIAQLESADYSDRAFLRIWTRKEAYLKFVGTGLSGGMQTADTTDPDALGVVFTEYTVDGDPEAVLTVCTASEYRNNFRPPLAVILSEGICEAKPA